MGKVKALSREHVRIDFRVPSGIFAYDRKRKRFAFRPNHDAAGGKDGGGKADPAKSASPVVAMAPKCGNLEADASTGGYVITCLSKNRIAVNGQPVALALRQPRSFIFM